MQVASYLLPSSVGEWSMEAVGRGHSQAITVTMRAILPNASDSDRRIGLLGLPVSTDQQL